MPTEHNPFRAPQYPAVGPPAARVGLSVLAKVGIVVVVLVSLGLGALGGLAFSVLIKPTAAPKVGDCLRITDTNQSHGAYALLSCRDSKAVFQVEKMAPVTSCARGDYTRFRITDASRGRLTLCLVLHVSTGECLGSIEDQTKIEKTSCSSRRAEMSVSVHDGVTGEEDCEQLDDMTFRYAGPPPRTVCLHRVGENI